eukprot:g57638.t1
MGQCSFPRTKNLKIQVGRRQALTGVATTAPEKSRLGRQSKIKRPDSVNLAYFICVVPTFAARIVPSESSSGRGELGPCAPSRMSYYHRTSSPSKQPGGGQWPQGGEQQQWQGGEQQQWQGGEQQWPQHAGAGSFPQQGQAGPGGPGLPTMPSQHFGGSMPMPSLPGQPAMPSLPGQPSMPSLPGQPAVPSIPGQQAQQQVYPSMPPYQPDQSAPATPAMPSSLQGAPGSMYGSYTGYETAAPQYQPPSMPSMPGMAGPHSYDLGALPDQHSMVNEDGPGQAFPSMSSLPPATPHTFPPAGAPQAIPNTPVNAANFYSSSASPSQQQLGPATGYSSPPPSQLPNSGYAPTPDQNFQRMPSVPPANVRPCHPEVFSCTSQVFPNSSSLRNRSNLPFGCLMRPLAMPVGCPPLTVVNFGSVGVVRCKQCRAYINPYVSFTMNGTRWLCNLCNTANDVPQNYHSPLDQYGRRLDLEQRPELTEASVEIVAPVEYMVRQPMPPVFFFVIDVSLAAQESGLVKVACDTILRCIEHWLEMPGGKRLMVGFITLDSCYHYYSIAPGKHPKVFTMPEIDMVFLPQPADLLVTLSHCKDEVKTFLEMLPDMYKNTRDVESCFGAALDAAVRVMVRLGGRMSCFLATLPSIGHGRLADRNNSKLLGSQEEGKLLQSAAPDVYRKSAIQMTRYQIGVDLYLFSDSYTDVATLSDVALLSGGQVNYYPQFKGAAHGKKFSKELFRALTRTQGWEAVVRVRSGLGTQIVGYYGSLHLRGSDLMSLPIMDEDKTLALDIANDDSTISSSHLSIQAALLYTTTSGERRIRVHTLYVPIVTQLPQLFANCNANNVVTLLGKRAIQQSIMHSPNKSRAAFEERMQAVLRAWRQAGGTSDQKSAQVMATLPLLALALSKSPYFRGGRETGPDMRSAWMARLACMSSTELESSIRPRLLPLESMTDQVGLIDPGTKACVLPNELPNLSISCFAPHNAVLLDDGFSFFLRLGPDVPAEFMQSCFGLNSTAEVNIQSIYLRAPDANDHTSPCRRVANVLAELRKVSPWFQQLHVIKAGDPEDRNFLPYLVEDNNQYGPSFPEYVKKLQQF